MKYQRPKGTRDILPDEAEQRFRLETRCRQVMALYGFREIEIPTFEQTELFTRSIGEASDIVNKEMYTFIDKGNRSLTLRPESTAGIIRALIENNLKTPLRLFHFGPMFRQERPQKGRFREFYQLGVEVVGYASALADAELCDLAARMFRTVAIRDFELAVNTVGCPDCAPHFKQQVKEFLEGRKTELCEDCLARLERNPLRVFDCKNETCRGIYDNAPRVRDHLCPECREHFAIFQHGLELFSIPFRVNDRLVRGIDYYTRTVFEFVSPALGAQDSLGGGGRYDNLVHDLGGPQVPATGFALGIERMMLAVGESPGAEARPVFLCALGEEEAKGAVRLAAGLRDRGIGVVSAFDDPRLKPQLRQADASGARHAVIIGPDELARGVYSLKDLKTGEQRTLTFDELLAALQQK